MCATPISSKKETPKGCLVLFGLPFMAAGLFFLFMGGIAPIVGYVRSGGWAEVPAVVLASEVRESHGESTSYTPVVRYRYAYSGRDYESDKLLPGWAAYSSDLKSSRDTVARYPKGARIVCRVNPSAPAECLLERRVPGLAWFIIPFSMIFVLVGGGITLGALGVFDGFAARRQARKDAEASGRSVFAQTKKKPAGTPRSLAVVIGFLFAMVGGSLAFFLGVRPAWKAYSAGSWPEVPCVIEASSVGKHRGSKGGLTYSVDIRYRYEFAGRPHVSDRYESLGGSSSGYEDKAAVVAKYPAGTKALCRVNPASPDEALLSRELGFGVWLGGGLGGLFFAVGLAVMGGVFSPKAKPAAARDSGPLKPKTGAVAGVLGMLFFAAFWNGIVSVFVVQAVKGFQRGNPEWFLCVFLIPFLLVGAVLLLALAHAVLKCFAPRFELVPSGTPVVGGRTGLRWRRTGGLLPLRSGTVVLEVVEIGKGTSRSGDRSQTTYTGIIRLERVAEIRGDSMRDEGTWSLALPDGLPPSLALGNNAVEWRLKLRVRDAFGISYTTEYPITVEPPLSRSRRENSGTAANPFESPGDAKLRPDADACAPGGTFTGIVEDAAVSRTLRLGWRTEGGGDVDIDEVVSCKLTPGQPRFSLAIPADAPPSYDGKNLRILWTLELCEDDRVLTSVPIVVSPTLAPILTADYEPPADLAPSWYPWVSKLRTFAAKRARK